MNQTAANRVSDTIARLDRKPSPSPKSPGQLAYEADLLIEPSYHDGQPRSTWLQLNHLARDSWERNPTVRSSYRCMNEHEALGMALGMLERIAEGRCYDSLEYLARVEELKRHYDRAQDKLAGVR